MNKGQKAKYIILSAIGGGVLCMIIGFGFGGWVTGGAAKSEAKEMADEAVIERLAPIALAQFMQDPNKEELLKELKKLKSWGANNRADYVKKRGWVTMPGEKEPDEQIVNEVVRRLVELKL